MNPKAPNINLEDSAKYRFASGSFALTEEFRIALEEEAMPMIRRTIRCYGSDSIELVGHTDGTPAGGVSNLDNVLSHGISSAGLKRLNAGSNADLGLLRALAVKAKSILCSARKAKGSPIEHCPQEVLLKKMEP